MEQENFEQEPEQVSQFKKVTPLSKYLAIILFVLLPFIGGWIGYTYAPLKVVEVERVVVKETETETVIQDDLQYIKKTDEPRVRGLKSSFHSLPDDWRTFKDESSGISFSFPDDFEPVDGDEDFISKGPNTFSSSEFTRNNEEYFYHCDGYLLETGKDVCNGPFYMFGVVLMEELVNKELIESWGAEVVSAEQFSFNDQIVWVVNMCAANGCSKAVYFTYEDRSVAVLLYNDLIDRNYAYGLNELSRKILSTLKNN